GGGRGPRYPPAHRGHGGGSGAPRGRDGAGRGGRPACGGAARRAFGRAGRRAGQRASGTAHREGGRPVSADVVIVGAGVIGAATAFHLSLLGAGDVLVLDRATVGSGMSCRSSALVRMHYTFGPEVALALRPHPMFPPS